MYCNRFLRSDLEVIAKHSALAKKMLDTDFIVLNLINQGSYDIDLVDCDFHPSGPTGSIHLSGAKMFYMYVNHLVWVEGFCEGYYPSETLKYQMVTKGLRRDYRYPINWSQTCLMVLGYDTSKTYFKVKLIVPLSELDEND